MKKEFKNVELAILYRIWVSHMAGDLRLYLIDHLHYSEEKAFAEMNDYFENYNCPNDPRLANSFNFILNFGNTVFDIKSNNYTEEITVIDIPKNLNNEIINIVRKPLIDYGLIVRKVSKDKLIVFFDKIYTNMDYPECRLSEEIIPLIR